MFVFLQHGRQKDGKTSKRVWMESNSKTELATTKNEEEKRENSEH